MTPLPFVQSAILVVGESVGSLSHWTVLLGLLGGGAVAKQSLWEWLTHGAVALLQQTLGWVLAERIKDRDTLRPQLVSAFQRVLIRDRTPIALCRGLAKAFPGSRNPCGSKQGQLKIQTHCDLLSPGFRSFSLSGFNRNDPAAAQDVLTTNLDRFMAASARSSIRIESCGPSFASCTWAGWSVF